MQDVRSRDAVSHAGAGARDADGAPLAPGRALRARKRVHPVRVEFAGAACAVDTLEGVAHARPGDAIVTGIFGERWLVRRGGFAEKYEPVAPLEAGAPGDYTSRPIEVMATRMPVPFEVALRDRDGRLRGQAGDWLVDYGDGTMGVVDATVFAATYDLLEAG